MIRTIAFDYTGVISQGPIMNWIKENLTPDDKRYELIKQSSHKWDIGEIGLGEAYLKISEVTGVAVDRIWETFFENTKLESEILGIIKKLKKNYKIILFSNHMGELLRKLLTKHEITDLFDDIIISSEHKMKKPSVEFFNALVSIAGNNKEEVILIDDTKENIDASNQFGIKAILYTDSKKLIDDLCQLNISL